MSSRRRALRLRRHGLVLAAALLVVPVVVACSSDNPPAGGTSSGTPGFDATGGDSLAKPDASTDGASTTSAEPLGNLPTVDEPDVPCVKGGGTRTLLFNAGDSGNGGPAVTRVQSLGARRFAAGGNLPGFITFDATGAAPQLFPVALGTVQTAFSSEGDVIGAMALNASTVDYQRYDANGAAQGAPVTLATGIVSPGALWMGSGGGGSLAAWSAGATLTAAGVTAAGAAAGAPWTLATGGTSARVVMAYANGKYAIAYSFSVSTGTVARFQLADATGPSGAAVDILSAAAAVGKVEVVAIVPTSKGFLLIFDRGADDLVYVVPLDASGKVSGPARRLLGGDAPWGLASRGDDVALVTMSNDTKVNGNEGPRKPQFRALDPAGVPLAPWVCFDERIATGQYQDMGVLAEPNGYAVVYKTVTDETALQRVDKLGTGAP